MLQKCWRLVEGERVINKVEVVNSKERPDLLGPIAVKSVLRNTGRKEFHVVRKCNSAAGKEPAVAVMSADINKVRKM